MAKHLGETPKGKDGSDAEFDRSEFDQGRRGDQEYKSDQPKRRNPNSTVAKSRTRIWNRLNRPDNT